MYVLRLHHICGAVSWLGLIHCLPDLLLAILDYNQIPHQGRFVRVFLPQFYRKKVGTCEDVLRRIDTDSELKNKVCFAFVVIVFT